ncbi:hypothetical protein Tco_0416938 [Tanacetum coccineum]
MTATESCMIYLRLLEFISLQLQKFHTIAALPWDYDSEMNKEVSLLKYTVFPVNSFRETLLLHMANVKKSVAERTHHKRHGIKSDEHITSNSSGTYITHVVDADIRPVNDQVPSAETIENADLKAQIQEKVFANVALKNELRKLKGNSMDTKNSQEELYGSSVMAHNHYLEEARKRYKKEIGIQDLV